MTDIDEKIRVLHTEYEAVAEQAHRNAWKSNSFLYDRRLRSIRRRIDALEAERDPQT